MVTYDRPKNLHFNYTHIYDARPYKRVRDANLASRHHNNNPRTLRGAVCEYEQCAQCTICIYSVCISSSAASIASGVL